MFLKKTKELEYRVIWSGAMLLAGLGLSGITESMAATKPNVLIILADDMGSADIGPYGGEIKTPVLDSLAKSGTTFTNFHTNATCSPTRSMLLSGVDNHLNGLGTMASRLKLPAGADQVGKPGYEGHLNDRVVTIANLMQQAGYHTYQSGKWHLGGDDGYRPAQRGFEESYALINGDYNHYYWETLAKAPAIEDADFAFRENDTELKSWPKDFYSTKNYTAKMIEYIDKNSGDGKPFFGYLAYQAPHSPLQAPDEYIAKYADAYKKGWDKLRADRFARQKKLGLVPKNMKLPPLQGGTGFVPWENLSPEDQAIAARKMAVYAAMIDYMDESIGKLLQHLKDIGEYDNTLIVFMSDNGPEANDLAKRRYIPIFTGAGIIQNNAVDNIGRPDSWVSPAPGFALASALPSYGAKASVGEGGIRNNLIISYPGATGKVGGRTNALSSVLDIVPTILDYAEVTYPSTFNGKSILPLNGSSMRSVLDGTSPRVHEPDETISMEIFGSVNRAMFKGDWKILCLGDQPWGTGVTQPWKLYNLKQDRTEQNDVSARYPARFKSMLAEYKQYEEDIGFVSETTSKGACANGSTTATAAARSARDAAFGEAGSEPVPTTIRDIFSDDF